MKSCILFFICGLSSICFAGITVGNGGNVIVCPDKTISLDLYEGQNQYFFKYQPQDHPWKDILIQKMQGLSGLKKPNVEMFLKWIAEFDGESQFVDADLGTIDDSYQMILPKNCSAVQAVIQQFSLLPGQKRYMLAETLWNRLSNWDKAALVAHELSYRYLQQANSVNARYFTALIFSDDLKSISPTELQKKMDQLGFNESQTPVY